MIPPSFEFLNLFNTQTATAIIKTIFNKNSGSFNLFATFSTICVIAGSSPPITLNIDTNLGTITITINITASIATAIIKQGYIIAVFIFPLILFSFSKCIDTSSKALSKLPDSSPTSTILTNILGKTLSYCLIDSDKLKPL